MWPFTPTLALCGAYSISVYVPKWYSTHVDGSMHLSLYQKLKYIIVISDNLVTFAIEF